MKVESRVEIEAKVRSALSDMLGLSSDEIKPESQVMSDLGADSLDVVEIVMAFEEEFDIEVNDDEFNEGTTVEGIVDLIASKVL